MAEIRIHPVGDARAVRCAGCRRPIYWATTVPNEKRLPLDRLTQLNRADGTTWIDNADVHWATCPERAQFVRPPRPANVVDLRARRGGRR